jgi:S-adenosylmethionine-dependent methyltransferase
MNKIAEIYDKNPEAEWERLERDAYHRLEFIVFMHHLKNHLPETGLVLDAGGGPGRYSIAMAGLGYNVVLLDLSSGNIDTTKQKIAKEPGNIGQRIKELIVGDVSYLQQFGDETFDAVLCFDPLSCLSDPADREKALFELVRVTKTGSPVAIAVRGYLAVLCTVARIANHELVTGFLDILRQTGNCNVRGAPHHFFRAAEIRALAENCGLKTLVQAAGEGLSSAIPEATNAIANDEKKWKRWVEVVIETSTDPAVVDTSGHMLYIGQKR